MKTFAIGMLLASGVVHADATTVCRFESAFDLRIEPAALVFHHDGAVLEMGRGGLSIDGRPLRLDAEDAARVRRYEARIRDLVPEVKALAIEAVALAGNAVIEVATSLTGSASLRPQVDALAKSLTQRIRASTDTAEWSDGEMEREVDRLVTELGPVIAGEVAAAAVRIAMQGDLAAADALRKRAANLQQDIEARIAQQARAIERRAQRLCPRLRELDALESQLDLRLPDGSRFDLLQPTP